MDNCTRKNRFCSNQERCQEYQRCLNEEPITEFEQLTIEHGQLKGTVKELVKGIYELYKLLKDAEGVIRSFQVAYGSTIGTKTVSQINTTLNKK